jgi:hypothetical protein
MKREHMSPEERVEYDALMTEAGYDENGQARPSVEIGDRIHAMLTDAAQAHRTWASWVLDTDARKGHLARWKRWHKARNTVLVSHDGKLLSRAGAMGIRRQTIAGSGYHQQVLFHAMSWDEVRQVVEVARQRIKSEQITVGMALRLLDLHLRAPESKGPGDACAKLGLDIEAYLASDAA